MAFLVPEKWRITTGPLASTAADGNNGAFSIPYPYVSSLEMKIIASDGDGWEHVSVSWPTRKPNWVEIDFVIRQFWGEGDVIVQFHPTPQGVPLAEPRHPHTVHLWRPKTPFPVPPSYMV